MRFVQEWRAVRAASDLLVVPGGAAELPRLPCERLYLEPEWCAIAAEWIPADDRRIAEAGACRGVFDYGRAVEIEPSANSPGATPHWCAV
jgi:hypothetical protein